MGDTSLFQGLKPFERRLIYLSLIGILFCLYLLRFYNFSNLNTAQTEREIGYVAEAESDIRIKNHAQTLWQSAKANQKVRDGDKVYTGNKSRAMIKLINESKIELKENSLVEFKKFKNQNLADLNEGEYRVAVLKDLKIAINGKVAKIDGKSEIVLKIDKDKKMSVLTLQGAPKIEYQSKTYRPTEQQELFIEAKTTEETERATASAPSRVLKVGQESRTFDYYLKLYDVYERSESQLKVKSAPASLVRMSVPLDIDSFDSTKEITVEYSANSTFTKTRRMNIDPIDRALPLVFLGDNHWRASQNEKDWSEKSHFYVRALTLPGSEVQAQFGSPIVFLKSGTAEVDVQLSTTTSANGYLVESSRKTTFEGATNIHWTYESNLHLKFHQPGQYFYRFRAVDEDLRLGQWSETKVIDVIDAPQLQAPQFTRREYKGIRGESLMLSWSNPDDAKKFKVKILNTSEEKIVEKVVTDLFLRWTPKNAGNYYAEVQSFDPYQRLSAPGRADIDVKAIEVRITEAPERDGGGADDGRDVASKEPKEDLEVKMQYPVINLGFNADFVLSRFTFSTNYYDGFNSKPLTDARLAPIATPGLQAAALKWMGHHGFEGLVQKNLTSNEPGAADFYTLEGRYHFRFYDNTAQAGSVGLHISPFVGYEVYSNSNATNFLSKYSMLKAGLFLEVPLMQSWTMGVLGAYGTGDSLTKYEAMWDMSYFFKKQWSMGLGLKTSVLFGTTTEFPLYPDYREGYSLGQFNLRYFF